MGLFDGWDATTPPRPQPFGNVPLSAPPPIDTTGTEEERIAFTVAMLRDARHPMQSAIELFGHERSQFCAAISRDWPKSAWFAVLKQQLLEEFTEAYFLPTKEQVARELYEQASGLRYDPENALKFYKLYCEVMDYVKTGGSAGSTVNVDARSGVMIVRDHGTDEEWAEKTREQQARLISAA